MRANSRVILSLAVFTMISLVASAQSTSPWVKIAAPTSGLTTAPPPGEGYMTVTVKAAAAYQDSNWWTSLVEKNRQAVLTANLSATIANVPVTQTVTGNAIALNRNRSMVDLGFAGMIVDHLPTTFSGMVITLKINKTAQDGLQDLISQISSLSTAQPPVLAISAGTMQITSLAKSVADFLFKSNLLVTKAQTRNPFPAAGALDPGIYVCFAGDQQSDYQGYLTDPTKLAWNGAVLTHEGQPIDRISYFVIEVDYETNYFAEPLDALNYGASKPWATLYLTAQNEIPDINSCAQAGSAQNDIQSHLSDARTLLTQDYGFTEAEKKAIAKAAWTDVNDAVNARLKEIDPTYGCRPPQAVVAQAGGAAQAIGGAAVLPANPVRPNLQVAPLALQQLHEDIVRGFGPGSRMMPTGH